MCLPFFIKNSKVIPKSVMDGLEHLPSSILLGLVFVKFKLTLSVNSPGVVNVGEEKVNALGLSGVGLLIEVEVSAKGHEEFL